LNLIITILIHFNNGCGRYYSLLSIIMLIPIVVFSVALLMFIYETRRQGRKWPEVKGWWFRAAFLNGAQVAIVYFAGMLWDEWFIERQSWAFPFKGISVGALCGYLLITFFFYWWHRLRHKSDFLWRWLHQIHHSPKRLEILTAFYKHPLEILADSVICSLILYPILGLSPLAASYAVLLSAFAELFYHWNVKTPYWVGFIFQRPESHCVHHQDGVHAYNYADLPLWDMLFGTFKNPKVWNEKCGLGEGEHRFSEMLLGVDISKTKPKPFKNRAISLAVTFFLVGLGLLQMIADFASLPQLKGLAMASGASPAPRVFCALDSLETFSSKFQIEWKDSSGKSHAFWLEPGAANRMKGPYNRRNVYGAVLSYGPLFEKSLLMKPLYDSVLSYGVSANAPLLTEMGIDPEEIDGKFWISVYPRPGLDVSHLPLKKEVRLQ
jgi:sterol desaturase/sphingolipid hydroxylase (fatty acid hydroxylase superfamily)